MWPLGQQGFAQVFGSNIVAGNAGAGGVAPAAGGAAPAAAEKKEEPKEEKKIEVRDKVERE